MQVRVKDNQSLFDIAIQTAGSAEAAFALALANDLSITDDLAIGQELQTVPIMSIDIANFYRNRALTPATAFIGEADESGIFSDEFTSEFE